MITPFDLGISKKAQLFPSPLCGNHQTLWKKIGSTYNSCMTRKNIIGCTLAVLGCAIALGAAIVGSGAFNAASSKETIWMDKLADTTSLAKVSLPGSHDSGSLKSMGGLAGKCQDAPISEQLKMGVRFFDIRLQLRSNSLHIVHGDIDQNTDFADTVREIDSFLDAHPSEFILLSVKEESKPSGATTTFEEALNTVSSKAFGERFYTESDLPANVGEARGKAILLSRFANPTIGINCFDGWADGGTPDKECLFALPNEIFVQDHYKLNSTADKIDEVAYTLSAATVNATTEAVPLFLNFFSGYMANGFPPSYSVPVARDLNAYALEHIQDYACTGVAIFDFASNALCDAVIGRNF